MARAVVLLQLALGFCTQRSIASTAPHATYVPIIDSLLPRAECPANTFQCPTSLGAVFSDICCSSGQLCALDNNNNPACCPSGAVCTGTAPGENSNPAPTQPISYVSNSYFSFPYALTTFDDSAACTSAAEACVDNYEGCTAVLGGNTVPGLAVTIQVPEGGGVTIGASASDLGPAGVSICSSLSSEACSHLAATPCEQYGNDSSSGRIYGPLIVWYAILTASGVTAILLDRE